jgi:hypothetical protein
MQRTRERQTEHTLQVALTRSRAQQIIPADDVSDAIGRIVDNDRKVIGPGAIGTVHDKIANFAGNILLDPASGAVCEHLQPGYDPHTPGQGYSPDTARACDFGWIPMPHRPTFRGDPFDRVWTAMTWVIQLGTALVGTAGFGIHVQDAGPAATAPVDQALRSQLVKRLRMPLAVRGGFFHRAVPTHTVGRQ